MQDYRYENWDEYEEDGDEQEEEEGTEEPYHPSKEELDYLELREKLKERFRRKLKKELGPSNAASTKKNNGFRKDSYGSFFGPSQPVIAQRVIEESKTLLENPELIFRAKSTNTKSVASAHAKSKTQDRRPAAPTSGLKKKVEILKQTRDYSFLQSDDTNFPDLVKNPSQGNFRPTKMDARSGQVLPRGKTSISDIRRGVSNSRDAQKPTPGSLHGRPKVIIDKTSKLSPGVQKPLAHDHVMGRGQPAPVKNGFASKHAEPPAGKSAHSTTKKPMSAPSKPTSLSQSGVRKPMPLHVQPYNKSTSSNGKLSAANKPMMQRKELGVGANSTLSSKSVSHASRDQYNRPQPKPSARGSFINEKPKAKPKRPLDDGDLDDEDGRAISMIRKMFGYNPNRFRDDEDDSDMEANFEDIMREERRSAKIARKEDEEQLRMIEEEERRERMLQSKKRKLT